MTTLSALAAFAAPRHHIVTVADLRALGYSRAAMRHLVATHRIFRVHRGVFVVGREQLSEEGVRMAAVLAGPPGGALGLVSAAVSWGLLRHDASKPQVIVATPASSRGCPGIDLRRSRTLTEDEIEVRDAIRTTSVLRTLSDLARSPLTDPPLNAAVRQAARLHKADLQQLRGKPRLDRIVRLYDPLTGLTESDFEALFLALCTKYRLPLPDPQTRFGQRRADFAWPRFRLAVECDSRAWHDNVVNHRDDRAKERALKAVGYELLRFTWAEVVHTPFEVAQEIRAAMRRRAHFGSLR